MWESGIMISIKYDSLCVVEIDSKIKKTPQCFGADKRGVMAASLVWMRNEKFSHPKCLPCLDAIFWTTWKISVYLCMLINYSIDKMALGY